MASTPAAANDLLKKIRRPMDFAITKEWITADLALASNRSRKERIAPGRDEQIDAFEKKWPLGSKERTALALHIWTGQRSQDVRPMTWGDITPTGIRVVRKTKAKLLIPVHPELRKALDAWHEDACVILPTHPASRSPRRATANGWPRRRARRPAGRMRRAWPAQGDRQRIAETGSTEKKSARSPATRRSKRWRATRCG